MGKKTYYICSYPKSGRTWLRFIIANYLNIIHNFNIQLNFKNMFHILPNDSNDNERGLGAYKYQAFKKIPLIISSHTMYDKSKLSNTRVIYLLRSVFDVIVSYYFHLSKQWKTYPDNLSKFVRESENSVNKYIDHTNSFSMNLSLNKHIITTYEQLHQNTQREVKKVIRFLHLPVNELSVRKAIAASNFENMQQIEIKQGILGHHYDSNDGEARRMRKGILVGIESI